MTKLYNQSYYDNLSKLYYCSVGQTNNLLYTLVIGISRELKALGTIDTLEFIWAHVASSFVIVATTWSPAARSVWFGQGNKDYSIVCHVSLYKSAILLCSTDINPIIYSI